MSGTGGGAVRIEAPAKVNLLLRVLERTPDGFHRLETLFQAVGLFDRLTLQRTGAAAVDLRVQGADVGPPEENLVTRAAGLFLRRTGLPGGVRILLEKRIPAGAGLGGGSSDAGATLRSLNALYGSPLTRSELQALGAELGADVAFFTGEAGLALGEGRGEELTPLPPLPVRRLVLGLPPVHVSTAAAYSKLARDRDGAAPPSSIVHPLPADWDEVGRRAVNDFEAVIPEAHPPIREALRVLRDAGAGTVLLSGSGAAVFGLFPEGEPKPEALARIRASGDAVRWLTVPSLARLPAPVRVEPERFFQ